jgi:hypothetical protein
MHFPRLSLYHKEAKQGPLAAGLRGPVEKRGLSRGAPGHLPGRWDVDRMRAPNQTARRWWGYLIPAIRGS